MGGVLGWDMPAMLELAATSGLERQAAMKLLRSIESGVLAAIKPADSDDG